MNTAHLFRTLGLASFVLLGANRVEAQPHSTDAAWQWESPQPIGNALHDLAVDAQGTVWGAGDVGTLGTLSADGRTWREIRVASTDDLRHIAICTEETVAVGMAGRVVRVHEGAVHEEHLAGAETLTGVQCIDHTVFISSGAGALWVSENSGAFVRRAAPHPLFALHHVARFVFASGPQGIVSRTSDGGRNWSSTPGLGYNIFSFAGDAEDVVGVGEHGAAIRSSDGGVSWQVVPTGVQSDLVHVSRSAAGEFVAIGPNDNVRMPPNGTSFAPSAALGEPYFAVAPVRGGWLAVGVGGRIAVRRGRTPFIATPRPLADSLYGFWSDGRIRIVVGDHGLLARGPITGALRRVRVPTEAALHSVMINGRGIGLAVGESGVVLRTTNGGARWTRIPLTAVRVFNTVWIDDAGHALIAGERGQRFVSVDAGITWQSLAIGDHDHFAGAAFRDGHLWLVGSDGRFERSDDFGLTWTAETSPSREQLRNILITTRGTMIISERPGRVYWRAPSGAWTLSDLTTTDFVSSIAEAGGILIAVTSQGGVFTSRDEGHTWSAERPFTHEVLNFVSATPNGRTFIGGYWGTLVSR